MTTSPLPHQPAYPGWSRSPSPIGGNPGRYPTGSWFCTSQPGLRRCSWWPSGQALPIASQLLHAHRHSPACQGRLMDVSDPGGCIERQQDVWAGGPPGSAKMEAKGKPLKPGLREKPSQESKRTAASRRLRSPSPVHSRDQGDSNLLCLKAGLEIERAAASDIGHFAHGPALSWRTIQGSWHGAE